MLGRISVTGKIHPISGVSFVQLLELHRPPFVGGVFVIVSDSGARLLWRTAAGPVCRQLSGSEAATFQSVWPMTDARR